MRLCVFAVTTHAHTTTTTGAMGGRQTHAAAPVIDIQDAVLQLNRRGVELAGLKNETDALACYLQACELEPTAPLQLRFLDTCL